MKHLLIDAKAEIERLRRENEILHAKVSTMEMFATVLHTNPSYPPMGACVDVAWELGKKIAVIEEADRMANRTLEEREAALAADPAFQAGMARFAAEHPPVEYRVNEIDDVCPPNTTL